MIRLEPIDGTIVLLSVIEGVIGLAAAGIAVITWRYRNRPVGFPLFVMALATTGYSFATALRSFVMEPIAWQLLSNLRYPLIATVAVGSFFVMIEFARKDRYRHPAIVGGLAAFLLVMFTAALTNPLHGWVAQEVVPTEAGVYDSISGPLYWVNIVVSLGIATAGFAVAFSDRRLLRGIYREQTLAFGVGMTIAVFMALWQALRPLHPGFDLISVGIFVWCVAILQGMFRADFLQRIPMARTTLVENMHDAIVALDANDHVIDLNPRAMTLFDVDEAAIGAPAAEVFDDHRELLDRLESATQIDSEIALEQEDTTKYFDLLVSSVFEDERSDKEEAGNVTDTAKTEAVNPSVPRIVVLHDSTERKRYEQQLETQRDNLRVLNQILRHDIRNDLSIVHGYADLLEDYVVDDGQEHLETIKANATSAIELTTAARNVTATTLKEDIEPKPIALRPTLTDRIEELRSTYPNAEVTVETTVPAVEVRADEMFSSVLDNLLHNAIQHNDDPEPNVWISAFDEDDSVRIEVADDGPGIPDDRKEGVFGQSEKGLESEGMGLGLYLVETLVTQYGGDVRIEDNEPEGSVFVVNLPKSDSIDDRV